MEITVQQLNELGVRHSNPHVLEYWLSTELPLIGVVTPQQMAMFIAQCGHESMSFWRTTENLNYSADALWTIFKNHFENRAEAGKYHRQPEKIANRVYANRMGNGPESSGDGWRYRGRGYLQVTGRANYMEFVKYQEGKDKGDERDNYILTDSFLFWMAGTEGAVKSACWFWQKHELQKYHGNTQAVTKIINGGMNGINDRCKRYGEAYKVFAKIP